MLKTIFIRSEPMSAILVKMPPGDTQRRRAERLTDGEADEARAREAAGDEQQDAEHQQQLDADQEHPDAHPRAKRDRVEGKRLPAQAGKRGARVGEGVHPDAEPRHSVAAGNADQAEEQDDDHPDRLEALEHPEVEHHDHADEHLEDEDELPLCDQVGLARLVDQLGHLEHRSVHREVPELGERHQAEQQPERTDHEPAHQQRSPVDAAEGDLRQVRHDQVGFAP
jgi:hypothetical protein